MQGVCLFFLPLLLQAEVGQARNNADLQAAEQPQMLPARARNQGRQAASADGTTSRQPCSRQCPCSDGSVFCQGLGYSDLPRDLRKDVTYINFQENALAELGRSTLDGFSGLQRLLLSANRIGSIAPGAFRHTRRLTSLDLSLNRLTTVPPGILAPLRQLAHLNMAHNELTSIDGVLTGLARLRTLSLHNNRIALIEPATFADAAHSLRYVDLTGNALVAPSPDTFSRLRALTNLLLSNNPLGLGGGRGVQAGKRLAGSNNLNPNDNNNGSRPGGAGKGKALRLAFRSPYIRQLAMRNCSLSAVPDGLPRSLVDLNLAENRISNVRRDHFARLAALVSLDLSYNALRSLDAKTFRSMRRLERLLLTSNRLTALPPAASWLPETIVTLRLDSNAVEAVERSTFARAGRLQELSLAANALRRVHPMAFANLTRLRLLTLNRNFITNLPARAFANLSRLMSLDLSDNPLSELPYGLLHPLTGLDSLRLCHIRSTTTVEAPLLQSSRSLRILDLDGSAAITAAMLQHDLRLYNLRSVQYLNLMRAGITTLDPTFPQYLPAIRVLQLSDNPWRCDRALYWLQRWLAADAMGGSAAAASVQHREHVRCETPRELAGRRIIDLDQTDWLLHDRESPKQQQQTGPSTAPTAVVAVAGYREMAVSGGRNQGPPSSNSAEGSHQRSIGQGLSATRVIVGGLVLRLSSNDAAEPRNMLSRR